MYAFTIDQSLWLLFAFVFLVVVACAFVWLITLPQKPVYQYSRKEFVMSSDERECYEALIKAVGSEYYLFPQIHLDCLLQPNGHGRDRYANFRHINQKSVDFVLTDKSLRTIMAIELDEKSHERVARIERDRIVEDLFMNAGITLVRIKDRRPFNVEELTKTIFAAMPTSSN